VRRGLGDSRRSGYSVHGRSYALPEFRPRIGFAYSPDAKGGAWSKLLGGSGTTSIRAAYGIYYTAIEQLTNALVVGDPPFGLFYVSPSAPQFSTPFLNRTDGASQGQRFPPPLRL